MQPVRISYRLLWVKGCYSGDLKESRLSSLHILTVVIKVFLRGAMNILIKFFPTQLFIFTLSFALSNVSWSYILRFETILSKVANHHGRGFYQITQDVTLSHRDKVYEVREIWTIRNAQNMHLEVVGKGSLAEKIHLYFIYKDHKRYQLSTLR